MLTQEHAHPAQLCFILFVAHDGDGNGVDTFRNVSALQHAACRSFPLFKPGTVYVIDIDAMFFVP
jgi:hypothetical protein